MTKAKSTPIWLTILNRIASADQRYRDVQKLKSLSKEHLADMGMTRADANSAFLRDRYSRVVDAAQLPITRSS